MDSAQLDQWLIEQKRHAETMEMNIKKLKEAKYLDEQQLRTLDATLKKVTTFTKKLKNISANSAAQLIPDLEKLNLSKYLDEIAANICEAKIKTSDLEALVEFCVTIASLYKEFSSHLIAEFRKHLPHKKIDKITNPSKLRVDLRFFAELLLNGIFDRDGLQLLGSVLAYLIQTDKQEFLNVSLLMPFCRTLLFSITGIIPWTIIQSAEQRSLQISQSDYLSPLFNDEQRAVLVRLFNDYWSSLVECANNVQVELKRISKSIKKQERTRGDASADDRQRLELAKEKFDRLYQSSIDLGEWLGKQKQEISEETSDDEIKEAATVQMNKAMSEGRISLWPDRDSQLFYEALLDVTAYIPTSAAQMADMADHQKEMGITSQPAINESIENVDLSCLEEQEDEKAEPFDEEEEPSVILDQTTQEDEDSINQQRSTSPTIIQQAGVLQHSPASFSQLLEQLPNSINKELIDAAAIEFLKQYARNKSHRKRLVQNILQAPVDRLDLLPFYARFIATIRPAYNDIVTQVLHELLNRFRAITQKIVEEEPKKMGLQKALAKIEFKLHLCRFLSELCKFGVLPKAEALTCLRVLLVQMRSYKIDMLSVMVESMGLYLYRSPESHSKMAVIMQVMKEKTLNVKDPRHKILLENAYFSVIPPSDDYSNVSMRAKMPPMLEFIMQKLATEIRVGIFRRLDWDDLPTKEFVLRLLSSPWRVHFDELARLASLVSALSDYHSWIGVNVLDDVIEFVRVSLETGTHWLQQKALSQVAYLGQLFNYNVCNTVTLFKVLYQLISLGILPTQAPDGTNSFDAEQMVVRLQRIRLVIQLVDIVCEFFSSGKGRRRMDHFLYFFIRFYYETKEGWSEFVDELEEFPEDVQHLIDNLLRTWRKDEQFPRGLIEARKKVVEIEELYKAKVEEIMRQYTLKDDDGKRNLNRIIEEDEMDGIEDSEMNGLSSSDDDDEDEQRRDNRQYRMQKLHSFESFDEDEDQQTGDSDEEKENETMEEEQEEEVRVHTQQQKLLQEDEDFMRSLDRLMSESLQSAPVTLQGPMSDLIVPPQAKQKFERKLTFAGPEIEEKAQDEYLASGESLLPLEKRHLNISPQSRMALMLRSGASKNSGASKGQVMLKPVRIEQSENLHEKWRQAKEEQERNRKEMMKVTLAMNDRITQQTEAEDDAQTLSEFGRRNFATVTSPKPE